MVSFVLCTRDRWLLQDSGHVDLLFGGEFSTQDGPEQCPPFFVNFLTLPSMLDVRVVEPHYATRQDAP